MTPGNAGGPAGPGASEDTHTPAPTRRQSTCTRAAHPQVRLGVLVLMSAASGAALACAFPPVDMGPVAWVALVPLFVALSMAGAARRGAACGLAFGLVFYGLYFQFLLMYGTLPWLATTLYQALFPLLMGLLGGAVMGSPSALWRVLGCAGSWTLVAYLKAYGTPVPFSGGDIAYSQYDQLPLLQMVSVVGQLGLTFGIAAVNASLAQALVGTVSAARTGLPVDRREWSRQGAKVAVACYGALICVYVAGSVVLRQPVAEGGRSLEVAVVQGNVAFETPTTFENVDTARRTYGELSRTVPDSTDLCLWPESAVPVYIQQFPDFMDELRQVAVEGGWYLLAGAMEERKGGYYNSALLYDPKGAIVDRYHKVDLVVFGEYVPFRDRLPFLERYPIRQHDLTAGSERKVFDVRGVKVAPLICFEGMFARPVRQVCKLGAQVIALVTSDSWADGTIEVEQHSNTACFRAVEARRYVCRAASSGVSAVYDPYGRVLGSVPIGMPGVLAETVHARDGLSVYHRIGDIPLVGVCLVLVALAWWKRK